MGKSRKVALILTAMVLVLSSCAPGPNSLVGTPDAEGKTAGFWWGLWHGIISPVTFIISLFNDNVNIYEVVNNGGWYNFGFMVGMSIVFGGGGGAAGHRH